MLFRSEIAGEDVARTIQLAIEYDPNPPFRSGNPNDANVETVQKLKQQVYDKAAAELRALGVRLLKDPEKAFWGGYNFYFADPDGHRWEVAFNPYATFDESGSFTEI